MLPSILHVLLTKSIVLMKAPPAAGKTSTAQLVAMAAQRKGHNVIFFNCSCISDTVPFDDVWLQASGGESLASILRSPPKSSSAQETIIIFYEAQALYGIPPGSAWMRGLVQERLGGDSLLGPLPRSPPARQIEASDDASPPTTPDEKAPVASSQAGLASPATPEPPKYAQSVCVLLCS